jgi:hypothetical protein
VKGALFTAGLGLVASVATPGFSQYYSERMATISPQAMEPRLGNIEIQLSKVELQGVIVTQRTPRGANEPDAWSVNVPNPLDRDQNTGLYCHFSYGEGAYMQMYFIDGTTSRPMLLSADATERMRELAEEVTTFTTRTGITANNIGLGIIREVPNSFLKALERVRKAAGGCNYKSVLKIVPHFRSVISRVSPGDDSLSKTAEPRDAIER